MVARGQGRENGNGYRVSVRKHEKVLEMEVGDCSHGCTAMYLNGIEMYT